MPDTEHITKYTGLLDDYLTENLVTSPLDSANSAIIDFTGAGTVKVPKITVGELGAYNKGTGFAEEEMTLEYDEISLSQDRGKGFSVDSVDDEETAMIRSAQGMQVFMKRSVVPQVDAYRFKVFSNGAGGVSTTVLTAANILDELDLAAEVLGEAGALDGSQKLYMSYAAHTLLKQAVARKYSGETNIGRAIASLDGTPIEDVRSICFTDDATFTSSGYTPGSLAINFLLLNPLSLRQLKKHEKLRVFSPDVNQKKDAWLLQYRLYHDAWVLPDVEDGIYVSKVAAAPPQG
jgi:hypothetical protein